MTGEITNHLWQSTLFAVAAGLLAFASRKNRAKIRYGLWLAASLKFLVPFSLLISLGSHLGWAPAAKKIATQAVSFTMVQITQQFSDTLSFVPPTLRPTDWPLISVLCVWLCGFGLIALMRFRTWLRIRAAVRSSSPLEIFAVTEIPATVEVRSSPGCLLEPGVVGLFHPVLLLPEGVIERLTPPQLEAVLSHELCHVRRRDNLTAAIHMIVEAVFWFHPLVWWIGVELVKERERACDEDVLRLGSKPEVYAEGILNVCKFYTESPLACVAGVTGHNLKERVVLILRNHVGEPLSAGRKLLLTTAGAVALALPLVFGLVNATPSRAKPQVENAAATAPLYEAVSIIPDKSGIHWANVTNRLDGLTATNAPLQLVIHSAYEVENDQISGGPNWINSEEYDIKAKVDSFVADELRNLSPDQSKLELDHMLQALLADRFKLTVHRETKEVPVYDLVISENGPKLQEATFRDAPNLRVIQVGRGHITGREVPVATLARLLSEELGRTVFDRTGLKDRYDITLQWPTAEDGEEGANNMPSPESSGPSIFTAIQEQLGLKLESNNVPVEFLVIDHVERPSIPNVVESLFQNTTPSALRFEVSSNPNEYRLSLIRAQEAVLKQDLWTLRTFISKYTGERQKALQGLDDLVSAGYIKQIPTDPITLKPDWRVEREPATMVLLGKPSGGIDDVHSSSIQTGSDGRMYSAW